MFDLFRSRAKTVRILLGAMLAMVALIDAGVFDPRRGNAGRRHK